MNVPILNFENFLIVSIQTSMHDNEALDFQDALLCRLTESRAKGVVLDITALSIVDSFMARTLNDIGFGIQLLGAKLVVVGIQPAVAMTLVEMGLNLSSACSTALDLDKGLRLLRRLVTNPALKPAS